VSFFCVKIMPGVFGSAPNWPHQSANNTYSILGVIGTLGTADTTGTALTVPIAVDPLTGAQYVSIIGTTANGTSQLNVNVLTGTQQTLGTVNVVQNAGTIQGGTLNVLAAGTFQLSYPSGTYLAAAGTYTVKSTPGIVHTINVGSLLGGGTLYNSVGTSASILWSSITPPINTYAFDQAFGSLTFAGSGAMNITIVYA
jgi:hypothetical protein